MPNIHTVSCVISFDRDTLTLFCSPYMLRKSNSTTNYHEGASHFGKDISIKAPNVLRSSPEFQRHLNIQRSSSNASIRNMKSQNVVSRRSSFNSSDVDRISSRGKFLVASDSSSETGEQQRKSPLTPISSGIKLNRAFSIRRARYVAQKSNRDSRAAGGKLYSMVGVAFN